MWFVADLEPMAADTYMLRYGPTPAATPPRTDLLVKPGGDRVEIATSRFGARLMLGRREYADPADAADTPGPLAAMRLPGEGGQAGAGSTA